VASCANPVPPSGGPRDQTPPSVVASSPARDTVNVPTDTRTIRLQFSEYVDRSSLQQALSVTPQFERQLEYSWDGQAVEIELPDALVDNTTYIVTLGTELSDTRGVSSDSPITIAFATGARINQGRLRGRVVGPGRGAPRTQVDIYAYPVPDTTTRLDLPTSGGLPPEPRYRTQTNDEGTFAFDYMSEQRYYVLALRDNNRNRRPDPGEAVAVPPAPALPADSTTSEVPVPWLLVRPDTTAPSLLRAEGRSRSRVRVPVTEPVDLAAPSTDGWAVQDSTTGVEVPVQAVYGAPGRTPAVVLRTGPMEPGPHRLTVADSVVTDTLGHPIRPDTARFTVPDRADTTQTRFRSFVPERGPSDTTGARLVLPAGQPSSGGQPGVRFTQAPDSTTLRTAITVTDTSGQALDHRFETEEGRTYRVRLTPPMGPGDVVELVAEGPALGGADTTYQRRFRRVTSRALGELEGRVLRADTSLRPSTAPGDPAADTTAAPTPTLRVGEAPQADSAIVEMEADGGAYPVEPRRQTVAVGSTFVFTEVPEGTFRFRAVLDRNGNGQWDPGQVQPYRPAEPVTWSAEPAEARPRWTTVLPGPLRVPVLGPPSQAPDTTAADTLGS
jgi:hypothetical protein